MISRISLLGYSGLAAAGLLLGGCLLSTHAPDDRAVSVPGGDMIFALTSDYKSAASYSAFALDTDFIAADIAPVNSDAVVRYLGGEDIYVLNRFGRDNLQAIDRRNLETVLQFKFPPLSNPYDVAAKDGLLYVGFYAYPKIGVYDQGTGALRDEIDITAYADTSDHLPETAQLLLLGNTLYALLENLDTKNGFVPLQARLLRINLADKSIQSLDLPVGNPISMAYDSAADKMIIPCRGMFYDTSYSLVLDGAVLRVDLATFSSIDTVATEKSLNGGVNTALVYQGKIYMDLTDADQMHEEMLVLDGKGSVTSLATAKGYDVSGMAIDGKTGTLYFGDRTDGLRSIGLADGKEKSGSKVKLGKLPILDLAVVR